MYPQTNMNLSMSQLNTAVANLVSIKEVALSAGCHQGKFAGDSWLSPANFRW